MKIAFLTPEFPHNKVDNISGGIGTSIFNLAQGIQNLGYEVIVLIYNQKKEEIIYEERLTIYKIKNRKVKGLSLWLTQKKIEKIINTLYQEKKIDIVETPDWTGISSNIRPKKCPVVIKLHGSDTYFCNLENRELKKKNYRLEKKALSKADAYVSVSEFTAIKTNLFFNRNYPFKILYNAINTKIFYPKEQQPKSNQTILYLGTLIRKKGVLEIPYIFNKVVAQNQKCKLILAGSDAKDNYTQSNSTWQLMKPLFSAKAMQNTEYIGKVKYSCVQKLLQNIDICIFPSFAEALPVSWLEAMAMKKTIIASNIGWAKEIIKDGYNGLLAHPKDHQTFAKAILKCMYDPIFKSNIQENARRDVVQKFDSKVIANHTLSHYKTLTKK